MRNSFWMMIGAGITALVTFLISMLSGKKPPQPTASSQAVADLNKDIQEIKNKTAGDIIKDHATPVQKDKMADIADKQTAKAMKAADKFKKPKP